MFALALVPLGFLYSWSWLFWAASCCFFDAGTRGSTTTQPLGWGANEAGLARRSLILILCFTATPIRA